MVLVAGMEHRSPRRLAEERQKHPLAKIGNLVTIAVFGIIAGLTFLAVFQMATAYMLQQTGVLVGAQ